MGGTDVCVRVAVDVKDCVAEGVEVNVDGGIAVPVGVIVFVDVCEAVALRDAVGVIESVALGVAVRVAVGGTDV